MCYDELSALEKYAAPFCFHEKWMEFAMKEKALLAPKALFCVLDDKAVCWMTRLHLVQWKQHLAQSAIVFATFTFNCDCQQLYIKKKQLEQK